MDDGVKENPAQVKETKFLGKAGWMKKATGKMLVGYKDRFIQVERTEIKMYENEDMKICLEKMDLENYEKCLELRSVFSKKNSLVLMKAPKSGHKVQNLKFQAQNADERDAWINALRDGINRAKNKIFDEVKIDENINLNHVTRTRPKVNHTRRPPTRIHMKEVANVSSDGILRLDLDLENATIPNGTQLGEANPATETSGEDKAHPASNDKTEEPPTQKKVLKPPMPPSKGAKLQSTSEEESSLDSMDQGPAPPMPPSKLAKPSAQLTMKHVKKQVMKHVKKHASAGNLLDTTAPLLAAPHVKTLSGSMDKLEEASESGPEPRPPAPPSKDKKPQRADEKKEVAWIVSEPPVTPSKTPPAGQGKAADNSIAETQEEEPISENMASVAADDAEEALPSPSAAASIPVVVVVTATDPEATEERMEEKSVDSGRHSEDSEGDAGSEGSECRLAASTAALRGSQAGLDEDEEGEDGQDPFAQTRPDGVGSKTAAAAAQSLLRPRSVSTGDLLANTMTTTSAAVSGGDGCTTLEQDVAREIQQTGALLSSVALGGDTPEDLLARAVAKLEMADRYLREAKSFKESKLVKGAKKRTSL